MKTISLLILSVVAITLTACCGAAPAKDSATKAADSTTVCCEAAPATSCCDTTVACEKGDACCQKTGKTCDTPCQKGACADKKAECEKADGCDKKAECKK